MEKMLPEKQKKKSSVWWLPASVAAAVALLFISLWLSDKPVIETNKVAKEQHKVSETDKTATVEGKSNNDSTGFSKNRSSSISTFPRYTTKSLFKDPSLLQPADLHLLNSGDSEELKNVPSGKMFIEPVLLTGSSNRKPQGDLFAGNVSLSNFHLFTPSIADPESEGEHPPETSMSKFSLGFLLSPDINSISTFSESSIGSSMGIIVSYQISQSLSINTGVAYSKKAYSAEPYQYKAAWAFSSAGRAAELINADCTVLDIPLNLSYNIAKSPKRTVFASAGLSSYLMLKEKYTLVANSKPSGYPSYSNPSYAYSNENQHLLSVLNVSAGVSKPIGKQTSLVVEPYMRMPLTGIGQGKVQLKSIGLNFQLKYNFKKSRLSKPSPAGVAQ